MCGIAGILDTRGLRDIDRDLLGRMNQSQFHRGPDEGGHHFEPGLGLAHRRLSIIDLSAGQQPMFNQDQSVAVVFNGEIYNFPALRKELESKGYVFKSHCDTEVIVHGWSAWGEACVDKFRGMFAFAVWDKKQRSLFLARDRLGIKPLFYSLLPDGQFIFGSELKVLKCHPDLPTKMNPQAVEDYFALGYIPEPKTIYQGVYKLDAGHTLTIAQGKSELRSKEYWDIPFTPIAYSSEAEVEEELIQRLREAVDIRMVAEVPLGAFLSGGVDSSAVVAMMAGLQPEPVNTCSIGFDVKGFDESVYAQEVAEQFNTRHHVNIVDPNDFDLIDQLAGLYDEPFADSSALPTYRVCQLAKQRVTVALSGDGGDEHFAGYRRYRWHMNEEKMRGLVPDSIRQPLFGLAGKLYPKLGWAPRVLRAKSTFQSMARDPIEGYFHNFSTLIDEQRDELFSESFKKELQGYKASEVFHHYAAKAPTDDPLSVVQYIDMKTYLTGDILTKVDRASMANSLEVRVPLLDHKFVEWVSGLPSHIKLKGQEGKAIFKSSLEPHLSNNILYRDKMGFAVPLAQWFRGPLKEKLRSGLLDGGLSETGMFNNKSLEKLFNQHQSGQRDNSASLWTLLMFNESLKKL
ncbi:MAG: amidotransferase 1, exosortase A system-associated [Gammaproteobacteria bacterium]|nr:amidotransferase 1, exosortase A system-associated [Gammaproteobacteria bacterium]MBQ0840788.1 amidotransferase 1, exosortase A system-associated [Gammaproteobacteria bacterium]